MGALPQPMLPLPNGMPAIPAAGCSGAPVPAPLARAVPMAGAGAVEPRDSPPSKSSKPGAAALATGGAAATGVGAGALLPGPPRLRPPSRSSGEELAGACATAGAAMTGGAELAAGWLSSSIPPKRSSAAAAAGAAALGWAGGWVEAAAAAGTSSPAADVLPAPMLPSASPSRSSVNSGCWLAAALSLPGGAGAAAPPPSAPSSFCARCRTLACGLSAAASTASGRALKCAATWPQAACPLLSSAASMAHSARSEACHGPASCNHKGQPRL